MKISAYKLNIDYLTIENHLKTLIYFHIAKLDSLRDINVFMHSESDLKKIIKGVSLGSLSRYNNTLDHNVLLPVMNDIITKALTLTSVNQRLKKFGTIKLIDSTIIKTCITYFEWAEYRATKAGVKIHTKFNLGKGIPETIVLTNAKVHDSEKINELTTENNCIYIFDRAYTDYKKFDYYCENNIFFITRLKRHSVINEVVGNRIIEFEERLLDESIEFVYDKVAYLGDKNTYKTKFPYRIIKILDENGKEIIFLLTY